MDLDFFTVDRLQKSHAGWKLPAVGRYCAARRELSF